MLWKTSAIKEAKMDRLQMLIAAHHVFAEAAGLPEGSRPYGVQTRLDTIEKMIMEEIENITAAKNDDVIPF